MLQLLEEVAIAAKFRDIAPLFDQVEPRAAGVCLAAYYASNCSLTQNLAPVRQCGKTVPNVEFHHHSIQKIDFTRYSRKDSGKLHSKHPELNRKLYNQSVVLTNGS